MTELNLFAGTDMASAKAQMLKEVMQVQAMVMAAQAMPRNTTRALDRILEDCKRPGLAEASQYEYKVGTEVIVGPSIRLAETMARHWGNMRYGIKEVERREDGSVMLAYAWDIESNVERNIEFVVKHIRETRRGDFEITSERQKYELVANFGQRRVRACILAVIPQDIQDAAVEQCNKTMVSGDEPLADRIRKMVGAFKSIGVSQLMLEKRLGYPVDSISIHALAKLRRIYKSIEDNINDVSDYFYSPGEDVPEDATGQDLSEKIRRARSVDTEEKKATPPAEEVKPPEEIPEDKAKPPDTSKADVSNVQSGPDAGAEEIPDEDPSQYADMLIYIDENKGRAKKLTAKAKKDFNAFLENPRKTNAEIEYWYTTLSEISD